MQLDAAQANKTEQDAAANAGRRVSWLTKGVAIVFGALLAGAGACAATNWIVGLTSNSSGEAQSATISNVTISAETRPAAGNLLSRNDESHHLRLDELTGRLERAQM